MKIDSITTDTKIAKRFLDWEHGKLENFHETKALSDNIIRERTYKKLNLQYIFYIVGERISLYFIFFV